MDGVTTTKVSDQRTFRKMRPAGGTLLSLALFALLPTLAQAVTVGYTLESLGGTNYRAIYTVTNDGSLAAGVSVGLFDIEFDPTLYSEASLTIATSAPLTANWNEQILASAPGVPALYDLLATAGGINCCRR